MSRSTTWLGSRILALLVKRTLQAFGEVSAHRVGLMARRDSVLAWSECPEEDMGLPAQGEVHVAPSHLDVLGARQP